MHDVELIGGKAGIVSRYLLNFLQARFPKFEPACVDHSFLASKRW